MHETIDEHFVEGILSQNEMVAAHNREHFDEDGVFVVNLMSAPGAGKTTLLLHTVPALMPAYRCAVIEGDMVGDLDAERLAQAGIEAHQISTGRSCHLDATMVDRLLHAVTLPQDLELLFIENVGNLVCPAEFQLGEHLRVVLMSVTEGADKPLKYPVIFKDCDAVVFTKTDLLPYVDFDLAAATEYVHSINPHAAMFALSTKVPETLVPWRNWLCTQASLYEDAAMRQSAALEIGRHHVHNSTR